MLVTGCVTVATIRKDPETGAVAETKTEFAFGLYSGPVFYVPWGFYPYGYPGFGYFGYYYNVSPQYRHRHGHR